MHSTSFADRLLTWFDEHGRKDLPWQRDTTPYRVWVSEVMLQQTQVATVIPYYERFMATFANVQALAGASVDDVLHHWSGLGYYARGRNLHKAAQQIVAEYDGEFPEDIEAILDLPGIGRSTAGAILALSRNERHPILDGNVKRVLARFHAIAGWPGKTAVANTLWEHAERHTPENRVADYTQAIMDLGATLCTRSKPRCDRCPMITDCDGYASGEPTQFPGKREKKTRPRRGTLMILAHRNGELYLERRPSAGIWGGLWSLPEIGVREDLPAWCEQTLGTAAENVADWEPLKHSFSHYDLDIQPLAVQLAAASRKVADSGDARWYGLNDPPELGLAAPVRSLIDKLADQLSKQEKH